MKNGELKIEKNIPIPTDRRGGGRGYSAALSKMKIGESVVLPVKSYSGAWQHAARVIGSGKFTVHTNDGGGFRVWRTA